MSQAAGRIYFDYHPRRWQREVLQGLSQHRFGVVVAHRRAGKTEAMCLRLLLAAMTLNRPHPAPLFGYLAPYLNQAKAVAWNRLKFYARGLPGLKINESELLITLWNGAAIRLFGADYPDRLRGLGFDGVVLDEVAGMRPETWPAVVLPALSDRGGWAAFIGTPKGHNAFYQIFNESMTKEGWFCGFYPAEKTGIFTPEDLKKLRAEMGDNLFQQEYLCDFSAEVSDVFIDFQAVHEAMTAPRPASNHAPLVLGLDVARFGDDRTVLLRRRGRVVETIDVWRGLDLMHTAARTGQVLTQENPAALFVDAVGLGAGVVDRLRELGHRVLAVNSGSRPGQPDRYFNLKAEMWGLMREWLLEGAVLPPNEELRQDLLAPRYAFDSNGRLKIESKDDLKKRGLCSTDLADALALTFAGPVAAQISHLPNRAVSRVDLDLASVF